MCGIFGCAGLRKPEEMAHIIAQDRFPQQHRGTSACGMHVRGKDVWKGRGLVSDVFPGLWRNAGMAGKCGIGHVRYPTKGKNTRFEAQPHAMEWRGQRCSVASNGDFRNVRELRAMLQTAYPDLGFKSNNDGELLAALVLTNKALGHTWAKAIEMLGTQVKGSYSAVMLTPEGMWAFRDPWGMRPMVLGELPDGAYVVASETCAFELIGAQFKRYVHPGEILFFGPNGKMKQHRKGVTQRPYLCAFEEVYFAWPTSRIFGRVVADVRRMLGRKLAQEGMPKNAEIVVPVPDSSNAIAQGFAEEAKLPLVYGVIRRHHVGRTFIAPDDRHEKVKLKFDIDSSAVDGKVVVLIDDSIVRGTTLSVLVELLYEAGAKEVHVRIGSPMVIGSCFYGIDTPTQSELIAHKLDHDVKAIRGHIGANGLAYLSLEGFQEVLGDEHYCKACFDLKYPV